MRRFIEVHQALELLDDLNKLENRLSTARQGAGEWPDTKGSAARARLDLKKPLAAITLGSAALVAAVLSPVKDERLALQSPTAKPPELDQLRRTVESLEKSSPLSEQSIRALEEKVAKLEALPPDEWYAHNTLEAVESLHDTTREELGRMQRELLDAAKQLRDAREPGASNDDATKAEMKRQMGKLADSMQSGNLQLSDELRQAL
jgi:hypothetical protein